MFSVFRKSLSAAGLLLGAGLTAWSVSMGVLYRGSEREATGQTATGFELWKDSAQATVMLPIWIHEPEGPPRVDSGAYDLHGNSVTIACSTCHASREPKPHNRATADLDQFHQGLQVGHGRLSCLACHNPEDYDSLRLADGMRVEYRDVMQLCAQCHGPQARDYRHGAHGGMTGYWDLSRGPRQRNNCIDCHDPHAPAYPQVMPIFPPVDRGKRATQGTHHNT